MKEFYENRSKLYLPRRVPVIIQHMLMTQKGINFNDMSTEFKRGVCCYRIEKEDICVDFKTKEKSRFVRKCWF